jgi:hypothetical protein
MKLKKSIKLVILINPYKICLHLFQYTKFEFSQIFDNPYNKVPIPPMKKLIIKELIAFSFLRSSGFLGLKVEKL